MQQDKTKILSDLYAIRATMSLIAENDDSADPERKEIRECKHSVWTLMDDIEKKKKSTRTELSAFTIDKRLRELNEEYGEAEEQYICAQTKLNEHSSRLKKNFICKFFENWWYGVTYYPEEYPGWTILLISLYIPWIFLCFPFSFIHTILDKKRDKKESVRCQGEIKQYQDEMARISAEIEVLTQKRDAGEEWITCRKVTVAEQEMRDFEIEANHQIAELEQKIPIHQRAIQAIAEKSQAIVESATKAYPLIDFRDWENVDLLIYYFETGRADDMKEALQLVDRQRQTEMLAKAIAMASAEIRKTIHQSMERLGGALSQSFSLISSQMAKQHVEMLKEMEEHAAEQRGASQAQLNAIRAQTAAQAASQAMNRALLERISESSVDLAEQMHRQMREVHHLPV